MALVNGEMKQNERLKKRERKEEKGMSAPRCGQGEGLLSI